MEQSIRLRRSENTYETRDAALAALNAIVFHYGEPVVVKYNVSNESDPNVILAVGITTNEGNETGPDNYRIVSDSKQADDIDTIDEYQTALGELAMPNSVGGIPAGTTANKLKDRTFTQLFDDLLFPTINPSIKTQPSATLSTSPSTSPVEIGITQTYALTASLNRGQYELNGTVVSGKFPASNATNFKVERTAGSTTTTVGEGAGTNNSYSISDTDYEIPIGSTTYKVTITYGDGDVPLDNKGNEVPSAQGKAGTKTASKSIVGVYPVFSNNSSGSLLNDTTAKLPLTTSNVIEVNFAAESGSKRIALSVPSTHNITKVEVFNTLSQSYETYSGGSTNTQEDADRTINGKSIRYNKWVRVGTNANDSMKFKFTLSKSLNS